MIIIFICLAITIRKCGNGLFNYVNQSQYLEITQELYNYMHDFTYFPLCLLKKSSIKFVTFSPINFFQKKHWKMHNRKFQRALFHLADGSDGEKRISANEVYCSKCWPLEEMPKHGRFGLW